MGAPLNFFNLLAEVAVHGGSPQLRRSLSAFSLFAVVVLDPTRDRELARVLQHQFRSLDRLTGQRLLFFAPVPPDQLWLDDPDVRVRPYAVAQRIWAEVPASSDPAGLMSRARTLLGLPEIDKPFLFVTRELSSKAGYYLETGSAVVEAQLVRLGSTASHSAEVATEDDLQRALGQLASYTNVAAGTVRLGGSVAEALAPLGIEPAVQPTTSQYRRRPGPLTDREERDHHKLGALLAKPVQDAVGPIGIWEQLFSLLGRRPANSDAPLRRGAALDQLSPTPHRSSGEVASWPSLLDPLAIRHLCRGDRLFDVANMPGESLLADNLSPAASTWCKAIELELNASAGHIVRRSLGVVLPEHFNYRQPGLRGVTVDLDDQRRIPFNLGERSLPGSTRKLWRAPAFGEMRLACEKVAERAPGILGFDAGSPVGRDFFALWTRINGIRNSVVHPGAPQMDASGARELRVLIHDFVASPAMASLAAAKPGLREPRAGA